MQALRNIYTVENHQIVIDLPKSFNHTSVEIIILPIEQSTKKMTKKSVSIDKNERLKKIFAVNIWNDEDIQPIIESQNLINQWKMEEF
jgi:hypothetical protein